MPFLHLPVQCGSDRILEAMNREHTAGDYLAPDRAAARGPARHRAVVRLHRRLPRRDATPDFEATLELVREVGFAQAFSFKYSPRPGTPAAGIEDQVPEAVEGERLLELQDAAGAPAARLQRRHGRPDMPVLFEKPGRHAGQLIGRSPYLQAVHALADPTPDRDRSPVRIERCRAATASAASWSLVDEDAA